METELHRRHQFRNLVGKSAKMRCIYGLVEKLSQLNTTVLITGESGTGKELIAKALHYSGPRATKPFIAVNCAALSESLLESELFGHTRGAFTGAIGDKQGRFQAAEGGTILLDEIGDISPLIQLKLLRVLQDKQYERVGEAVSRTADVRVLACTNKDLKEKIARGEFREDLYYRLKVVEIALPSLRERQEDVPPLAEHFRMLFNRRLNRNIERLSTEAMAHLMNYSWPGNTRELEHVIERAFVLCRGNEINAEHLPREITHTLAAPVASRPGGERLLRQDADLLLTLENARWNKARTAAMLGISRQTLYRRLKALHIDSKECHDEEHLDATGT
jgi:two-component system, NtrC family, response regulator HydG